MFIYLFSLDLLTVLFLYIYVYSPGLRLDLWRLVSAHTCPLSRVSFAEASPCCCIWWAKRSICSSRLPQRGLRSRTSTHPPTLLTRSECHRVRYSHSLQLSNDQVRAYNLQMRLGRALRATLSFTLGRRGVRWRHSCNRSTGVISHPSQRWGYVLVTCSAPHEIFSLQFFTSVQAIADILYATCTQLLFSLLTPYIRFNTVRVQSIAFRMIVVACTAAAQEFECRKA